MWSFASMFGNLFVIPFISTVSSFIVGLPFVGSKWVHGDGSVRISSGRKRAIARIRPKKEIGILSIALVGDWFAFL